MEILTVNEATVILDDKGGGAGKIIIASDWGYNFSSYWGSMGGDLNSFICDVNAEYFADRLIGHDERDVLDIKATMTAVRKAWADLLPWYIQKDVQKGIREEFNRIQRNVETKEHFVHEMTKLGDQYGDKRMYDPDIYFSMESLTTEPWNLITTAASHKLCWLRRFHKDLVKAIKAQKK